MSSSGSGSRSPVVRLLWAVAPVLGLLLLFGGWELYVRVFDVRPITLPRPSDIVRHVVDNPSFYARAARVTLGEAIWGFVLAFVSACLVAAAMTHSRFIERATVPVIVLIQSTPVAALAPVFLLWYGFSPLPKILVAALFAFFPFVANALTGFRAVDSQAFEVLESVDAGRWAIFWRLRVPNSLPYLFSAARICVALALVGAVIGEAYGGSTEGLGYRLRQGQTQVLIEQLWGSIFTLAFLGVVGVLALSVLERRLLRWHPSQTLAP